MVSGGLPVGGVVPLADLAAPQLTEQRHHGPGILSMALGLTLRRRRRLLLGSVCDAIDDLEPRCLLAAGINGLPLPTAEVGRSASTAADVLAPLDPIATTLALSPSTFYPRTGQTVSLTAVLQTYGARANPPGEITFTVDGQTQPAVALSVVDGVDQAVLTTTFTTASQHSVSASYAGSANFVASSSGPLDVTVIPAGVKTPTMLNVFTPVPELVGNTTNVIANVVPEGSGVPSGTVSFTIDGVPDGSEPVNETGTALLPVTGLAAGQHTVSASYSGDGSFAPSTGSFTINILKYLTQTKLTAAPNPANAGKPVTFDAQVSLGPLPPVATPAIVSSQPSGSPPISGTVTFMDGNQVLGTAPLGSDGTAVFTTTLVPGTHVVHALYSGDPTYGASTSLVVTETVDASSSTSDGPQVVSVQRVTEHGRPAVIVITFNEPLNRTSAQNRGNYQLVGPRGHTWRLRAAFYNATLDRVTLHPATTLNPRWTYRLMINGSSPSGVADTSGRLLDGADTGEPGSNHVATLAPSGGRKIQI